jgi:hypothetical protein
MSVFEGASQVEVQTSAIPHSVEDLRIPASVVEDLVLRRAMLDGRTSILRLSKALALSVSLVERLIEDLRNRQYLQIQGSEGRDLVLTLSELGKAQANERMQLCRYVGPAPVSLADYTRVVLSQTQRPEINEAGLRAAFSDLVINDALLDELGPAIRSKGAMFLYGPPGTGKSAIAERLVRVDRDVVLVPHAIEVDGQIITVFDPGTHAPVDPQPDHLDPRWMACRRPSIVVGCELTADQLELAYEANTGIYLAPMQMLANNGVLVIDDFGRQRLTPEQLLNRWIVPLDRAIDHLSLAYGFKFVVPCVPKIVFSTNLEPSSLGDEAFFRRIRSKVLIPPIDDDQFDEVLRIAAAKHDVTVAPDAPEYLRWVTRNRGDGDLRAYLPGSVCEIVESISGYEGTPRLLDRDAVDRVANLYFAHQRALTVSDEPTPLKALRPPPEAGEAGPDSLTAASF